MKFEVTDYEVDAYLEAALWTSTDPDTEEPLDRIHGVEDFTAEARQQSVEDLRAFAAEANRVLSALERNPKAKQPSERVIASDGIVYDVEDLWPHDFWLTRNRHGVGFWDRPETWGDAAEALSELAHRMGEVDVYPGDDGRLHLSR